MTKPVPVSKIRWLKDGAAIVDGAIVQRQEDLKYEVSQDGAHLKLFVNDIGEEDAGIYAIQVEEAFHEIVVTVKGKACACAARTE